MPPFFWLFIVALVVLLLVVFAFVLRVSLDGRTIADLERELDCARQDGWVPCMPVRVETRTRNPDGWRVGDLEDLAGERGER